MSAGVEGVAALREAADWRLAGLLLERPRAGWYAEVSALARETDRAGLARAAAAAAGLTEGSYLAVFGPGGRVSPREVAYRPLGDPGRILGELRGIHRAFGFHPRTEDPPDHVATQAGFAGFMRLRQAYALETGDLDAERMVRSALDRCLEDHLGGFVGELASELARVGPEHLATAAAVLVEMCPEVRPSRSPLRMAEPEEEPFGCGSGCQE